MYNSTSGSVSTITFKSIEKQVEPGWYSDITTFVRILNGHTHKGVVLTAGAWWVDDDPVYQFKLCTNFKFDNCVILKPITLSQDLT
jgi:hypothetical protein